MGRLRSTLESIERTLSRRAPSILLEVKLRPPASDAVRLELARAVGLPVLPVDLDDLFGWHDGQDGYGSLLEESVDFGGWALCTTEEALANIRQGIGGDVAQWDARYVPVIVSGGGDLLVVDVGPGELVWWSHEKVPPVRQNESLAEFFERHAAAWSEVTESLG